MSVFLPSLHKATRSSRFITTSPRIKGHAPIFALPVLLVLTLLLLFIAYQNLGMVRVAVGPRDQRFISGTHELEPLEDTGLPMRWTKAESSIKLPLPAAATPLLFDLKLMNHYPHELADHPEVDLLLGEEHLLHFIPDRQSRHYRILLPPQERFGWGLPFTIQSTTVMPADDPRPLGAVLVAARLAPLRTFPVLPPLWQVAASLIGVAAAFVFFRGVGAAPWLAWVFTLALAVLWAILLARLPMQIAPFSMRVAGLCVLGAVFGAAVHLTRETVYDHAWVSVIGLVLLMGVASWLMPVYQIIMTVDGIEGVTPYPPTLWIGGVALAALVLGLGALAASGNLARWTAFVPGVLALAAVARLMVMLEFVMDNSGVAVICIAIGFTFVAMSEFLSGRLTAMLSVVALLAVVALASQFDPWQGRSGPDFWILFRGARDWVRGGSLYNIPGIIENHFGHSFKVPPFYGMLFVPFATRDGLTILFWHRILNMMLLSAVLFTMLRGFKIPLFSALGAGLVMLFNMRPIADTVAYGQIDIMLLLLLTLALVASQRGYDRLAGAAIALATLFKLYPALFLLFFIIKRQWRALVGFALAMLVCNGVALAVMGWEMHAVYLFEVIPRISGGTSWVENQTLNGFLSRIYAPDITSTVYEHPTVTALTYAGFALATFAASAFALQPAERTSPRYMLHYGFFVLLLVLVVPAAWMHYQTVTVLTFAAVLVYAGEFGLPRWMAALLALAYGLIAYGNQWSYYLNEIMGVLTIAGVSFKFYGLLLVLVVIVGCLLDQTDQAV